MKASRVGLPEAARAGDLDGVRVALAAGADLDERGPFGLNALQLACQGGHAAVVAALLDAGAPTRDADRLVGHAVGGGSVEILERLLEAGLCPDDDARGGSSSLLAAARDGSLEMVERLLDAGADPLSRSADGDGLLHLLAARWVPGDEELLLRLAKRGLEAGIAPDDPGFSGTPLDAAARRGRVDLVRALLDAGARAAEGVLDGVKDEAVLALLAERGVDARVVHAQMERDCVRYAPGFAKRLLPLLPEPERRRAEAALEMLTAAAMSRADFEPALAAAEAVGASHLLPAHVIAHCVKGNPNAASRAERVRVLAQHGFEETVRLLRVDALVEAARAHDEERVRELLEAGVPADGRLRPDGPTPLLEACGWSRSWDDRAPPVTRRIRALDRILRRLVESGASLETTDADGRTALLILMACYPRNLPTLLSLGADPNAATGRGYTPLMVASVSSAEQLLRAGADVHARTASGESALHLAPDPAHAALLLANGAELDARDSHGATPLCRAATLGREEVVRLLLDAGAEVDASTAHGRTPLHHAALAGHDATAEVLLAHGADPARADGDGLGLVHHAARAGRLPLVEKAIAADVPVDAPDATGRTALMHAAEAGRDAIVEELLARGADPSARDLDDRDAADHARRQGREALRARLAARARYPSPP